MKFGQYLSYGMKLRKTQNLFHTTWYWAENEQIWLIYKMDYPRNFRDYLIISFISFKQFLKIWIWPEKNGTSGNFWGVETQLFKNEVLVMICQWIMQMELKIVTKHATYAAAGSLEK